MNEKILRHRLHDADGDPIRYVESPNRGGTFTPTYLVMHFTAGRSADSSIRWLSNPQAKASAHIVVARDGTVTQLVPFNRIAWHAGPSRWAGRNGMNAHSLGIELDNAGPLDRVNGAWRTWFGETIPDEDVMEAVHKNEVQPRGWQMFPTVQLEAAMDVAALLVQKYDLIDVIGHDDISPGRKVDPGPAFPMRSFRSRVLGRTADDEPAYRTTANLNVRVGPGTQHDRVIDAPLPSGTELQIFQTQGTWHFVDVVDVVDGEMDVQGWVHGGYVERIPRAEAKARGNGRRAARV